MPLVLLIALLLLVVVLLGVVALPLSLWQRYRYGRARRRAQRWALHVQLWLLTPSTIVFLVTAWLSTVWSAHALRDAVLGLCVGVPVGIAGIALTRVERVDRVVYYTPNRWLVLGLTLLVASRIVLGLWLAWQRMGPATPSSAWQASVETGGLWSVGGLLIGYALAYAWGLRARVAPLLR